MWRSLSSRYSVLTTFVLTSPFVVESRHLLSQDTVLLRYLSLSPLSSKQSFAEFSTNKLLHYFKSIIYYTVLNARYHLPFILTPATRRRSKAFCFDFLKKSQLIACPSSFVETCFGEFTTFCLFHL